MSTSTLERAGAILRLVCTLVAAICTMCGLYMDADELFCGVCAIVALVCLLWCWWKNNNLTDAAIEAQSVLDALKSGDLEDLTNLTTDSNQDGEIGEEDEKEDDPEGDD